MSWITFWIIAMLCFGSWNAFTKKALEKISPKQLTFYRGIVTSIFFLIWIFFLNFQINFERKFVLIAILLGIVWYIPLLFFYKAVRIWKIWIISPIANSYFIWTVLFSILFLWEKIWWLQILSILIIIFWVILTSINFKDWKNSDVFKLSSWIPFALLTCIWRWLFFFLSKYPINILWPILTWFIMEFVIMFSSFVHMKINKEKVEITEKNIWTQKKSRLYIFLIWFFGAVWVFSFNIWITKYNVSLISSIVWASPIIPIIFSKFFYKEHIKKSQYVAVWIILIWLILISL